MNRKFTSFPYRMSRRSLFIFHAVLEFLDLTVSNGKFQCFEKCHGLREKRVENQYSGNISRAFEIIENMEMIHMIIKCIKS